MTGLPDLGSAHEPPQATTGSTEPSPERSWPITSGPAADHPTTRAERLPAGRSSLAGFLALVLAALLLGELLTSRDGPDTSVYVLGALTVLAVAVFSLMTTRHRTQALLRRHPWVEVPATITLPPGSRGGKANLTLTGSDGTTWLYATWPPNGDYALGRRPVWCAGATGAGAPTSRCPGGAPRLAPEPQSNPQLPPG